MRPVHCGLKVCNKQGHPSILWSTGIPCVLFIVVSKCVTSRGTLLYCGLQAYHEFWFTALQGKGLKRMYLLYTTGNGN